MYSHTISAVNYNAPISTNTKCASQAEELLIRYLNVWGGGGIFLHHVYRDRAQDDFHEPEIALTARITRWQIETAEFWGNFPQACSMLCQTNAAIHLSRQKDDLL
ncbi:hypothetical protein [Mesorhizobium sp. WSM2239]|uniref:Uncharacterized protein n=2 Tax=unclassified Mesorhizobium TaxID=325217 RepID=A0AAU8DIS4_9HYPH